jgi:hypothetical protein
MLTRKTSSRRGWMGLVVPLGGGSLAFLLAVVLLLCHGVFGVHHLLPDRAGPVDHGERSPLLIGEGESQGQPSEDGPAGEEYFAVLIVVLLGLVVLRDVGPRYRVSVSRSYEPLPRPLFLPPQRGPTAPLLRVFRL